MEIEIFHILLILYALVCAVFFFIGLMIFQATLSFWSVHSLEIINAFTYGGIQTAQYPIDIYQDWFKKIFIYIIPIGSVSYYPLRAILRGGSMGVGCLMPLLGLVFFAFSLMVFRLGSNYYCSTGS